jgi:hypothetical protein
VHELEEKGASLRVLEPAIDTGGPMGRMVLTSDKLPGIPGVGPKRAAQLLRRYGTLDGVLAAGLFQTQADLLRLYRLIATMDAKAPFPRLPVKSQHGAQHRTSRVTGG